mmetsp:Transcript_16147/g.39826  ORF Transcript_16147/g.39826 Transcript_16147/m.39826 type:complete len:256 (-) Transcript_16147:1375-2142(-)
MSTTTSRPCSFHCASLSFVSPLNSRRIVTSSSRSVCLPPHTESSGFCWYCCTCSCVSLSTSAVACFMSPRSRLPTAPLMEARSATYDAASLVSVILPTLSSPRTNDDSSLTSASSCSSWCTTISSLSGNLSATSRFSRARRPSSTTACMLPTLRSTSLSRARSSAVGNGKKCTESSRSAGGSARRRFWYIISATNGMNGATTPHMVSSTLYSADSATWQSSFELSWSLSLRRGRLSRTYHLVSSSVNVTRRGATL